MTTVTRERAIALAEFFIGKKIAKEVYVFGSVARDEEDRCLKASDIDMIIVPECDVMAWRYLADVSDRIDDLMNYHLHLGAWRRGAWRREDWKTPDAYNLSDVRLEVIQEYFSLGFNELCPFRFGKTADEMKALEYNDDWFTVIETARTLDIFVFPSNWKTESCLSELQEALPHSDPLFMKHIAHNAKRFDPETRTFM